MKVIVFSFACLVFGSQFGCQKKAPPVTHYEGASSSARGA